jgi:predicted transcriptional regulator
MAPSENSGILELGADLTVAWLSNPHTRASADEVISFLSVIHGQLASLDVGAEASPASLPAPAEFTPAVSVRKSLANPDSIISMIDGKPYRTLKRHLSSRGLTPAEYRQRYGLKADYPMVAQSYSAARSDAAKRVGLGRKASEPAPVEAPAAPKRRGRKSVSEAKAAAQQHLKG